VREIDRQRQTDRDRDSFKRTSSSMVGVKKNGWISGDRSSPGLTAERVPSDDQYLPDLLSRPLKKTRDQDQDLGHQVLRPRPW